MKTLNKQSHDVQLQRLSGQDASGRLSPLWQRKRQSELRRNAKRLIEISDPEDIKEFIQKLHWEENYSLRDIAKIFNRSWWWIVNFKKKYHLKVKSRTQSMKDKFGGHHPGWKGGKKDEWGYILIYKPEHPNSRKGGYIAEHRYVMSEILGRPLTSDEVIHHKDGNKKNNSPENLQLMTMGGRGKYHGIPKFCPKCNYELKQEIFE